MHLRACLKLHIHRNSKHFGMPISNTKFESLPDKDVQNEFGTDIHNLIFRMCFLN